MSRDEGEKRKSVMQCGSGDNVGMVQLARTKSVIQREKVCVCVCVCVRMLTIASTCRSGEMNRPHISKPFSPGIHDANLIIQLFRDPRSQPTD